MNLIRSKQPISRSELAQLANLSLPTVMRITDELIDSNAALEIGKGASTGGKPPKLLVFNDQANYIIGVDINYYRIDTVMIDMSGNVLAHRLKDITSRTSRETIVDYVIQNIDSLFEDFKDVGKKLIGIGISLHASVDKEEGKVLYSAIWGRDEGDIRDDIQKKYNVPVKADIYTRAMAVGERLIGCAKNDSDYLCVNFSYNVDSSFVHNGKIVYGADSRASLIGKSPVAFKEPGTDHYQIKSLDEIASFDAIENFAKREANSLRGNRTSLILDLVYGHVENITVYTIIEAAYNGDPLAKELLENCAISSGIVISSLINSLNPSLMILAGNLPRNSKVFMDAFTYTLAAWTNDIPRIELTAIRKHMGAIGAAMLILDSYLSNGGQTDYSGG